MGNDLKIQFPLIFIISYGIENLAEVTINMKMYCIRLKLCTRRELAKWIQGVKRMT